MEHLVVQLRQLNSEDLTRGLDYLYKHLYSFKPRLYQAFKTFVSTRSIVTAVYAYIMNRDLNKLYDFDKKFKQAAKKTSH